LRAAAANAVLSRALGSKPRLPSHGRDRNSTAFTLILTCGKLFSKRAAIFRAAFSAIFCCLLIPCATIAQQQQQPADAAQQPLRVNTEIVQLDVSVLAPGGDFVSGLERKNFRVLDGGVEQPLVFFAPTDAPAQILVMVETGPAVYLIQNQHIAAAYALLQGLAPDDQVSLVTYDQAPRAVLAFTPDKNALLSALGQIQFSVGMGDLNFYDSISTVLDWIAPANGKKALVLLSTGIDSSPPGRWEALVRKLRASDVVIFPVALGGWLRRPPEKKKNAPPQSTAASQIFANSDQALRSLAAMTGGRAFFPDSAKDFVPAYHQIAAALRHQYLLGITPEHDGQFHPLTVQVLDANGQTLATDGKKAAYRIFSREGYLAPGP
jgi:Ca-activated chloride channel homolog